MQNSCFIPRSECFAIFALSVLLFSDFQQSERVFTNQHFQPDISMFCHFCTRRTTLRRFSAKSTGCIKQRFLPKINVLPFSHWAYHFLAIFSKAHEFVQNSCFIPRSECFAIFALSVPLFSDFQQSKRVCTNQHFQPDISMFVIFALGAPL